MLVFARGAVFILLSLNNNYYTEEWFGLFSVIVACKEKTSNNYFIIISKLTYVMII